MKESEKLKAMAEIAEAFEAGETVEFRWQDDSEWAVTNSPVWLFRGQYRVQPVIEDETQYLNIPWGNIPLEYKWAAKDKDQVVYLYKDKPHKQETTWFHSAYMEVKGLLVFNDIDWEGSLTKRPSSV